MHIYVFVNTYSRSAFLSLTSSITQYDILLLSYRSPCLHAVACISLLLPARRRRCGDPDAIVTSLPTLRTRLTASCTPTTLFDAVATLRVQFNICRSYSKQRATDASSTA